ncbi:MAG: MFS transporter [Puniceicoccaceae bacterium]
MSGNTGDTPAAPARGLWAWTFYDWANQAFATVVLTFVFAAYFTNELSTDAESGTARWSTTIGATGFAVAVCGPVLGAIADRAGRRKPWLAGFTLLCAAATSCLWWARPDPAYQWPAIALLAVAAFGVQMATVFYNALFSDLVSRENTGRWSGRGWAMGYLGGICCLLAVLFLFVGEGAVFDFDRDSFRHVRASFPFVGAWLVVFSLPLFLLTPDRPASGLALRQSVAEGLGQLRASLRDIRAHANIVRFLLARALYTNGLVTIFALGGVYAAGTFGMEENDVLLFGIALSVSAGVGSVAFGRLDDHLGSRRTISLTLGGLTVFSSAMIFAPDEMWFWIFGLGLGLFVGPAQSAGRSYLAHAAPEALRAQMFGLYALADKSTAFMGPLTVAAVTSLTDSQRLGLATIPLYLVLGWLVLLGTSEVNARDGGETSA